ncbi:hypothetical protein [Micromonospora inositola]|uniref:hypothetical protein n=1 Tax=Micromonospora inositola TaxID=47865 RepID=UPI0012FDBE91|nr:hypothetical protein [Micromonospora inositola]
MTQHGLRFDLSMRHRQQERAEDRQRTGVAGRHLATAMLDRFTELAGLAVVVQEGAYIVNALTLPDSMATVNTTRASAVSPCRARSAAKDAHD